MNTHTHNMVSTSAARGRMMTKASSTSASNAHARSRTPSFCSASSSGSNASVNAGSKACSQEIVKKRYGLSDHAGEEVTRRGVGGLFVAGLTAAMVASSKPSTAFALEETESFLRKSGAKGLLVEEEERLIKLRLNSEANAKRLDAEVKQELEKVIERARAEGEAEAKKSFEQRNSLCATPYGIDIVGITEGIALVGALVGGIAAKSRKDEVQKLNDQLRTINVSLRKQARSGIVYAPDMNYAPPSGVVLDAEEGSEAKAPEAQPVSSTAVQTGKPRPLFLVWVVCGFGSFERSHLF